jgi:hypothetical protein
MAGLAAGENFSQRLTMKKTIALLLAGCAAGFFFAWIALGRYQITQVGSGSYAAYRLDRFTGEIYFIRGLILAKTRPEFFDKANPDPYEGLGKTWDPFKDGGATPAPNPFDQFDRKR